MYQIVLYSLEEVEQHAKYQYSPLSDPKSFDKYAVNFIDMRDERIWEYKDYRDDGIDCIEDIKSIGKLVQASQKATIVIMLPQNIEYAYGLKHNGEYEFNKELKAKIHFLEMIVKILSDTKRSLEVVFGNTETMIGEKAINSAFFFKEAQEEAILKSSDHKTVALKHGNIIYTGLDLENLKDMENFLRKVGIATEQKRDNTPEWLKEVNMFDDEKQGEVIQSNQVQIEECQQEIEKAEQALKRNLRYKSILYTQGDELVEVVFEILSEMLGVDLSNFEDKKKEDFLFEICGKTVIGEVKGVTHNVKSENISQLDVHYQSYLEENQEKNARNVYAWLIMNYQRKKPINERESVHENQIRLAERNGSLIIGTPVLLNLYEKYKNKEITKEECLGKLSKKGLLRELDL
jgi:hypothetical protein